MRWCALRDPNHAIFGYRERKMRYALRREQPVSLRRHYPHQVPGRSSVSSLSAFRLPFGCAFIFAHAPRQACAGSRWVSLEMNVYESAMFLEGRGR